MVNNLEEIPQNKGAPNPLFEESFCGWNAPVSLTLWDTYLLCTPRSPHLICTNEVWYRFLVVTLGSWDLWVLLSLSSNCAFPYWPCPADLLKTTLLYSWGQNQPPPPRPPSSLVCKGEEEKKTPMKRFFMVGWAKRFALWICSGFSCLVCLFYALC